MQDAQRRGETRCKRKAIRGLRKKSARRKEFSVPSDCGVFSVVFSFLLVGQPGACDGRMELAKEGGSDGTTTTAKKKKNLMATGGQ